MPEETSGTLPDDPEDRAGTIGWAKLLNGSWPAGAHEPGLAAWAERLADLISPAMADHLLGTDPASDAPLVNPERAAKGRLYNRFLLEAQIGALRLIKETGAAFVCMKGFALAHQVYAEPAIRIIGDLDLLLYPADLPTVTRRLSAAGYAPLPIPSRFGFISDSSFLPIVSADGQVAVDLHIAPDAWPAPRALDTEAVFRQAVPFRIQELELWRPAAEHEFFLILTNIAKDRFGPEGVRKIVDAAKLLRAVSGFDWDMVAALVRAGGYRATLAALGELMGQLGAGSMVPAALRKPIGLVARRELEAVTVLYRGARVTQLGTLDKLRRELLLGPDLLSVLRINAKRLSGLARPGTGVPPGMA
jgi:putative nucleotidyltransferase-like protein